MAITKAKNGFVYRYSLNDLSVGLHMLLQGDHESWLVPALSRSVALGYRVADVGANIGYHSVWLAREVGPGGYVYCCEPNGVVRNVLETNLVVNGMRSRCAVVDKVVSDKDDDYISFFSYPANWGGGGVFRVEALAAREQFLPTIKLDTLCHPLNLIKVDAEGSEAAVINGARSIIQDCRPNIILENNPDYVGDSLWAVYDWLLSLDYKAYLYSDLLCHAKCTEGMQSLPACDILFSQS